MKNITILILLILPFTSFARKPAVEPVTGISIDEYKDVPPSQAKGFNWTNPKKVDSVTNEKSKFDSSKLPEQVISTAEAPDLTPAIVLFFMTILPFAVWFFLLGKLEEPVHDIGYQEDEDFEDNTLAFPNKAKEDSKNENDDDDDFDVPKAS